MEGVKISYIKTKEATKVCDKDGKPLIKTYVGKDGKTKINPKTNEPYYDFVYDIKELPKPILETTTLYHTSQIPNLNQDRLKNLISREPQEVSPHILKNIGLTEYTEKQINNYLKAQAGHEKYVPLQKAKPQEKAQDKSKER